MTAFFLRSRSNCNISGEADYICNEHGTQSRAKNAITLRGRERVLSTSNKTNFFRGRSEKVDVAIVVENDEELTVSVPYAV